MNNNEKTQGLPKLSIAAIWFLSFGILGVQMSFGLMNSQLGRIFQTLGTSPSLLGLLFIILPIAGLFVQPLVGGWSDRTWIPKWGRRIPYLIVGTIAAAITLFLLPNVGDFGWPSVVTISLAAVITLVLMVAFNMCVQPYKMLIGDMVNQRQSGFAYSIQSFFLNIGSVLACLSPWLFTEIGVSNTASKGMVPNSVIFSFYVAVVVLIFCTIVTVLKVDEYPPKQFNDYHGLEQNGKRAKKSTWMLLKDAPRVFWVVSIIQLFAYIGFAYMWMYGTSIIAKNVFNTTDPMSSGYQAGGNLFGILSAVYALAAVVVSLVLARIPQRKYKLFFSISLVIGGMGFLMSALSHTTFLQVIAFILIGVGWAGISVYPLTFVTREIPGKYIGVYMGLFNVQICIPQIVASLASPVIVMVIGSIANIFVIAAVTMVLAAGAVWILRDIRD
ncbi:MFS transporter [Fructilactobacillus fructivorans]|uniref:MFS transporter n=2 Tax=Fructilactobacillus fructivorans TaxID=1614 RepID=A0AAE6P092_9LACO|nr:MFS transporter [Fructilactobacillus fructivorans]KRK58066.1 major facilitator superfamily permease [Fructilactobacillus fructivorans]QFX92073.1 MFS transporter [Fructilactobacillus fructivorans]RDV65118.1 MFS transporter [Fructilactobacillus fructivorans]